MTVLKPQKKKNLSESNQMTKWKIILNSFFFFFVCVFKTDTENISIFQDTENWENRKAIASTQVSSPF